MVKHEQRNHLQENIEINKQNTYTEFRKIFRHRNKRFNTIKEM